ncbi:SMC family ATPase [Faecalibacillus intestinalis]|uniref:Nuclease SbcCD subunit C n=1 Tax=Faecalibacillus intestinalis TaxID=1982626 RepID=A0AAP2UIS3_9FIRM|nr:SMC family ATPase [Faecalibacillus intestinalis]MCB8593341.1 SMC family ATPase [Faecalibacillus intestinalis]MCB8613308.1 SMC family ATPase [Faecalibacillus intestinalis]MCG4681175.1 SMC family ATPase [Faecalibacillus intestinalis]MCG4714760.1 SMC family ATPase [Faecalibacillus intestinalis]MCG4756002.1 SMC family ATPase [Faecalibacillus intestinalis]
MMPISLTLSAFGPYPDTITIDFESFQEDGLFLITGPTGSGKTMIFDAMIFALYGKTSGQIRQTDSLRCDHALNEIPTFVEFSFSLHQQNYTIKRNPKYYLEGKKTPKQPSALLILPDGKMVEGIKEVNQKMISLLGVDDQQFKQICMIAQGEFTKLIMASSDEREKVLRELFHSETYQKLEEKLKVHLKTYQDKYDLLLNKRKDLMQELQVEDHQEYLSKQTKLIASQQKEYDDLKKDLDQKKQQLQLYRLQNQRLIQLKDLKQQFQDLKKQENDYQKLNKTVDTLKKAQETNYLYISYIKQQKKLQTLKLNQEDFLKQLKKLEKDYQEKKVQADSLDYKQQTKEKLQNQIQETKQLINQIYQYQNDYQNLQTLKQQYRMLDEEHKLFLKKKEKFENGLQRDQERIQSEQQVQSKYELIKQQYVRLNEQKVKVHQLSDYYDQILKLNENKSDLQEEYTVVEKQVDHEKMQYNKMEKLYFRKQAGIFALQLKEDQPCPICGSLHHPHPAQIEKEDITKEKLDQQAKKVKQQEHRLQDILQKILLSNQKKEMLVKQTKQLSSELNIQEEISKEIFIKELDHLSKDEKRMKKEYLELQDELKYIQKLKKSVALSLKDMSTYESKELKQAQSLENIQVQIHQLSGKLNDSLRQYEIGEVNKNYQQVQKEYRQLSLEIETIQQDYEKVKNKYLEIKTKISSLNQQIIQEQEIYDELDNKYHTALDAFINEEEFLNLKTQINQISILEKKYQDYLISLKSLNEQIISLENEVKDSTYVDLSSLSETIKEVNQQLREKNDDLEKLKIDYSLKEKMIKDIQKINQQLEKDEDTYQRYLDLYNLASGKNNARVSIERYVLATYFENMLIYANVIMKQLSQGRYQLLRKDDAGKGRSQQGLELDVFDQESGNIRSIKTLSGGESFKAALSLALGLSRMVQDYAGGIELNTLFIDEGFGSLDSQSLDQAMNCLMELHHENKLIGIISHVSDLKDRIERQLVVERKQKQSVIQMI